MSDSMKVLVATGAMNAGGAETLIMEILRHQTGRVQYAVLVHYAGEKPVGTFDDEIQALDVPIYYIHTVGSVGLKQYTRELGAINRQYGPFDVIHSHLNGISGAIAKAAKQVGIPSRIAHCHADITFKGSFIRRAKEEALLQLMRHYIDTYANQYWACSSQAAKRLFYKRRLQEAVVIPNIIDVEKYLSTGNSKEDAKKRFSLENITVIGAVGRIAPIKNYEYIIRLVKSLKDSGTQVTFACFGRVANEDYYQSLLDLAKELDVEQQVKFLGNSTNVAADIHCFDIFVMPSFSEGFGIAAIEAQAAGLPTVVSTGVSKAVDMGLGLVSFIDLEKEEQWVETIRNLCQNPPADVSTETIIRQFTQNGFNAKTAVETIENRYIEMIETTR